MIVVLDYGLGNVQSISNMLNKIGVENVISSDIKEIERAEKYILPGVGSFDEGLNKLINTDFFSTLEHNILIKKKPILGICLGMQMLAKRSKEGVEKGLGWVDAIVVDFNSKLDKNSIVPHMGWNKIHSYDNTILFNGLNKPRFYFVHSYFMICTKDENIAATTKYGIDFTCAISNENIYGVQFHPEKSHKYGMQLLTNFSLL